MRSPIRSSTLTLCSTAQNNKKSPLLRFPGEIRNKIYQYALGGWHIHTGPRITKIGTMCQRLEILEITWLEATTITALPSACRQLHAETHLLLFTLDNDFSEDDSICLRMLFEKTTIPYEDIEMSSRFTMGLGVFSMGFGDWNELSIITFLDSSDLLPGVHGLRHLVVEYLGVGNVRGWELHPDLLLQYLDDCKRRGLRSGLLVYATEVEVVRGRASWEGQNDVLFWRRVLRSGVTSSVYGYKRVAWGLELPNTQVETNRYMKYSY